MRRIAAFLNFTHDRIQGRDCNGDTVRVGLYPLMVPASHGAMDMSGRSQWVVHLTKDYYFYSPYYNPQGPQIPSGYYYFGYRGGSYRPCYI